MASDFSVILDACVLVQAAVRDTLLRLFERRLFLARWTDEIMDEVVRTLEGKLHRTPQQTDHLVRELREHFADAWVEGYRQLIPAMTSHQKDKHVVAAAVKAGCEVIVTYNLKHFPADALRPFGVEPMHPDEFLVDLYHADGEVVVHELHEQGRMLQAPRTISEVLNWLEGCECRNFARLVRTKLGL